MHVIFRESRGLEDTEVATDLGQPSAPLIVLSFSDSDLGAFAAGWHLRRDELPALRLANLAALKHPLSVDTYVERTLAGAKAILIRLIGGTGYWPYGLAQVSDLARRDGIALAVLPGDGRADLSLDAVSTMPVDVLRRLTALCDTGGAQAACAALAEMARVAGLPAPILAEQATLPDCGWYRSEQGWCEGPPDGEAPLVAVTFYRAYLTSGDTGPIDAMIAALQQRGFRAAGLFAPSLKAPDAARWLREELARHAPAAIINATAFSARDGDGSSPLDTPGYPVFQIALSTAPEDAWREAERGLSPADLAMHVVLPEVDGRIFAGVASFKAQDQLDPDLYFARTLHQPHTERIAAIADKVAAWHRLGITPAGRRHIALILSTYPGREDQMAHAVGLDALASAEQILNALADGGYDTQPHGALPKALPATRLSWPVKAYVEALAALPAGLREELVAAWGQPQDDPACHDGAFHFAAIAQGKALVALQPERGETTSRDGDYHDLSRIPRHGYVAFYLWLRAQGCHAIVQIGAHGTLEWLPGKAVALSEACWSEALTGGLPVIYPFIVNDPGEAAQAKRRIGAVTLGHVPPPMVAGALPEGLLRLERLLDEYSTAEGLDPARRDRLIAQIHSEASASGVIEDLGLPADASAAEAMVRIDRFVCDIKESQFGDGLHTYGDAPGEMAGLMTALSGRRVEPGPSGSPARGRCDVLPTGRNLFSVDPRAVPSRMAHAQGVKLAEELLRRHMQDHGDWPKGLVLDLWGSATMRTAGEEFAMALHLAGLAPRWDAGSERVSGFEILPPALLGRPRIDVTLRVSGLFRDVFPGLAQMFEAATQALAQREDEEPGENPYRTLAPRVFGPRPGHYGLAMADAADHLGEAARHAAGEAWLAASAWAIDAQGNISHDRDGLNLRLSQADAFAHVQDLPETDLLVARDYAAHEGGFAAAMAALARPAPALYHLDATRPEHPHARALSEEVARVVRARAADPRWAEGMMRHGFRGGAEIAATLDNLAAFAQLTRQVPAHLFDLYFEATLGREELVDFLAINNPLALARMKDRFAALAEAGLWVTRRNSIAARLEGAS
ncbi:MAG: cobaltochelatase subunit CobN [Sphingomonadales bacterium]|nr:cobaltochelatase subunit CobN [Sphingomonadales bacterium]MDE2167947.1 cobaltochelatase subunit CobN [Sphingomonadales bacterium]